MPPYAMTPAAHLAIEEVRRLPAGAGQGPAAHLAIEDVRRPPAGAGQGAACTATLEEETFSQQAADQTLLVRHVGAKLGGAGSYMHAKDYNSIYGIISEKHVVPSERHSTIRRVVRAHQPSTPFVGVGEHIVC